MSRRRLRASARPRPAPGARLVAGLRGLVARLNGDAAYERFIAHRCAEHPGEPLPSRREFWCGEVERKWQGVNRCC